jgi:hypothetical protein
MLKTPQKMMDKVNGILLYHQQIIRIISWSGTTITLSNGSILSNKEKQRFVRRVTSTKTDQWAKNIDKLIQGNISEKEIKSNLSRIGGNAVQKKYGDTIRQNLNTGTPWNAGTKGQNTGTLGPRPRLVKDKISKKNSGTGNGMYGVKMSDDDKKRKSILMRNKILEGIFTPNSNNRNTHWDTKFNGRSYRSSWEALYQFINPNAEYEILRIEYIINDIKKIYIVDFVDHKNKLVIEVKPRELCVGNIFQAKLSALTNWANSHDYKILIADKEWFKNQKIKIDYKKFDDNTSKKIKNLYETN